MTTGADAESRPVPLWARVCDALALAALLVALSVVVFDGFTARFGPVRVSSHSWWRPLVFACVLLASRHVIFRAHPLHRRIVDWIALLRQEPVARIVATAVGSRLAVLVVGYVAVLVIGFSRPYGFALVDDPLMNLPARFDAGWYSSIAVEGYRFEGRYDKQQNIAFFPAYPMLLRAVGYLAGGFQAGVARERRVARALWGGVLVSILAFTWGAFYVARLARDTIGDLRAIDAVTLLAAYPFALYFSAPYTEALFLLGTVASFYHFRRREWLPAALWGGLVGLTRPNGCLLSVVLGCVTLEHLWRRPWSDWRAYPFARAVSSAAAPALAMLVHSAYIRQVTGDWFGWARVQIAWGRSFQGLEALGRGWEHIYHAGFFGAFAALPVDMLNALALLFTLALLWPVFHRIGLAAAVFVLLNVVPPLVSGGVLSMGRFTSTLFPIFLALAAILPRPVLVPLIIAFAIGQGMAAVLFFTWRPLF